MPDYSVENELHSKGYNIVCGVDEAGRGPLAGPVCAAAVILEPDTVIEGLNDSKKLSEKKREALYDVIIEKAKACAVTLVDNHRIDEINILEATFEAMEQSVDDLKIRPDCAIIDGNRTPKHISVPCVTVVKGDSISMSVAAASILAKVTRDRLMYELAKVYPEYQFEKHKGYGTALHCELLRKFGPCDIHRASFLKKILK